MCGEQIPYNVNNYTYPYFYVTALFSLYRRYLVIRYYTIQENKTSYNQN